MARSGPSRATATRRKSRFTIPCSRIRSAADYTDKDIHDLTAYLVTIK